MGKIDISAYIKPAQTTPSPADGKQGTTPVPQKETNPWNDKYAGVLSKGGFDENDANNRIIVSAINGKYDNIINGSDVPNDLKTALTAVKNHSEYFANSVVTPFSDMKRANASANMAINVFRTIATKYSDDNFGPGEKQNKYVIPDYQSPMDKDSYKIYDSKQWVVENDKPSRITGTDGASFKLKVDGNDIGLYNNKTMAHNQMLSIQKTFVNDFKEKGAPLVQKFVEQSILGAKQDNALPEDRKNSYAISRDILLHVAEYGVASTDPKVDAKYKEKAKAILNNLSGHSGKNQKDWNTKLSIIQNSAKDIQDITSQMGAYGNQKIFQKHANTHHKYVKHEDLNNFDAMNQISNDFEEFSKAQINLRGLAMEQASQRVKDIDPNVGHIVWDQLMDKSGHIKSFNQFQTDLESKGLDTKLGLSTYTFGSVMSKLNSNGGEWDTSDRTDSSLSQTRYKELKALYDKGVVHYKNQYNNLDKDNSKRFGMYQANALKWEGVDVNLDSEGVTNNKGQKMKQGVVNKILQLPLTNGKAANDVAFVVHGDKAIGQELKGMSGINDGSYTPGSYDEFQEFLSTSKNKTDATVQFRKYTNIPNTAAYTVTIKGKAVTMLVPYSKLKEQQEYTFINSFESRQDWTFERNGVRNLPPHDGVKNPRIVNKDGYKQLAYVIEDEDGKEKEFYKPLGANDELNIDDATKIAQSFFPKLNK